MKLLIEEYVQVIRVRVVDVPLTEKFERKVRMHLQGRDKPILDMDNEEDQDLINCITRQIDEGKESTIRLVSEESPITMCIMKAKIKKD